MSTDRAWQRKVDALALSNVQMERQVENWKRLAVHILESHGGSRHCFTCDYLYSEATKEQTKKDQV